MHGCLQAKDGGQLESTSMIDNYPGFENGVDAVGMIQSLQKQAERFGAKFKQCTVVKVELKCRPFKVSEPSYSYALHLAVSFFLPFFSNRSLAILIHYYSLACRCTAPAAIP